MADTKDFWVAIAAAAPIIALASAVTAENAVGRAERNVELAGKRKQLLQGRRKLVYWFTYINGVLQAGALALALYSLGFRELGVRLLAFCLVVAGLLLVFLPTVTTTWRVYTEYDKLAKRGTEVKAGKTVNWY
jgi:hypothetical protein